MLLFQIFENLPKFYNLGDKTFETDFSFDKEEKFRAVIYFNFGVLLQEK